MAKQSKPNFLILWGDDVGQSNLSIFTKGMMGYRTPNIDRVAEDVICDNVSSHKTKRVEDFLAAHRNVQMHFTPTYSSWLNQVENWFSRIQRDVISRGIFTSVKDLSRKLMRYVRAHNKDSKPIKWKYDDPSRRIRQVPIH